MSDIDTLLLTELLGQGLQDHGVTDDVMQTDAVSQVLGQLADTINQQVTSLQGKVQQQQQQAADTNKDVQQLIKVGQALTEALQDRASPQPLPQQDMNAPEESTPAEQPHAPDTGMVPPPEANIPPVTDMGMQPPAPDAGMVPPAPAPDMTAIDPSMIGALQSRF